MKYIMHNRGSRGTRPDLEMAEEWGQIPRLVLDLEKQGLKDSPFFRDIFVSKHL